jgi:hypothetical protein
MDKANCARMLSLVLLHQIMSAEGDSGTLHSTCGTTVGKIGIIAENIGCEAGIFHHLTE